MDIINIPGIVKGMSSILNEINVAQGSGINLVNTIPLAKLDISKFKNLARNWKIAGSEFAILDQELGFSSDVLMALTESKLQSWVWFDANPEPAQLRFLATQNVKVVIVPAQNQQALLNIAQRVHRSKIAMFVRVIPNSLDHQFSANTISLLLDSDVDGILDFNNSNELLHAAINASLLTYTTNPHLYKDIASKNGHGGASYFAAVNPKLASDSLQGDVVAHTEIAQRSGTTKEILISEINKSLTR
jgi:hypothetical protein